MFCRLTFFEDVKFGTVEEEAPELPEIPAEPAEAVEPVEGEEPPPTPPKMKTIMLATDCLTKVLLRHIRSECGQKDSAHIDLKDADGAVAGLWQEENQDKLASEVLQLRGQYNLVSGHDAGSAPPAKGKKK